jgi:lipoate-protein ligase A
MVVRALHKLGVDKTRVNERHDIVLDSIDGNGEKKALKVSGSAYKLTRLRSLHHGTCLLNSANLAHIGKYLHPYAAQCIEARGVASVSSPVTNVNVSNAEFEQAVISEFAEMYGSSEPISVTSSESMMGVPEIEKGYNELKSADWIYGQTPQFTFSDPHLDSNVSPGPPVGSRSFLPHPC